AAGACQRQAGAATATRCSGQARRIGLASSKSLISLNGTEERMAVLALVYAGHACRTRGRRHSRAWPGGEGGGEGGLAESEKISRALPKKPSIFSFRVFEALAIAARARSRWAAAKVKAIM